MQPKFGLLIGFATLGASLPTLAATDEIQVYDAEIVEQGKFNLTLHNNYTPIGVKQPGFSGGVIDDHALNGVPEFAYGVTDWFELGAYVPLYTVTRNGSVLFDGVKLRSLFVSPHAQERTFFYGLNFELSYNQPHWETTRFSGEIRPILGYRIGAIDLIANPILDTQFKGGLSQLDFAPAGRVAYNLSKTYALGLEYYADFGRFSGFEPADRQSHTLFAVFDYKDKPAAIEFGIGHGFTGASDSLVLKLILSFDF